MVLKLFGRGGDEKELKERYRSLIGKPIVTSSGRELGKVVKLKVRKETGELLAIIYETPTGEQKTLDCTRVKVSIVDGAVVISDSEDAIKEFEISMKVSSIKSQVNVIREKIKKLQETYMKLIDLFVNSKIDSTTFSDVKAKLDAEKARLQMLCEESLREIEDSVRNLDEKTESLRKRRNELYVKKVLGNITPAEETELNTLEETFKRIDKLRQELLLLRTELIRECANL